MPSVLEECKPVQTSITKDLVTAIYNQHIQEQLTSKAQHNSKKNGVKKWEGKQHKQNEKVHLKEKCE